MSPVKICQGRHFTNLRQISGRKVASIFRVFFGPEPFDHSSYILARKRMVVSVKLFKTYPIMTYQIAPSFRVGE